MFPPLKSENTTDDLPQKTAQAVARMTKPDGPSDDETASLLSNKVLPVLERIERNTRRNVAASVASGKASAKAQQATTKATRTHPASSASFSARSARSSEGSATLKNGTAAQRREANSVSAIPKAKCVREAFTGSTASALAGRAKGLPGSPQAFLGAIAKATRAATKQSGQSATPDSGSGETKSSRALAERRQVDSVLAQKTGIVDALKGGLANWDGRLTGRADPSDAADAAGSAAGGAVWASITELREAAAKMADNERGKDPEAMSTIVAQAVKKATGVTRVSESLAAARERTRARVVAWAGGPRDTAPGGKGQRDSKGRFLSRGTDSKVDAKKPVPVKFDSTAKSGGGDSGGGMFSFLGDIAGKGLGKLGGKVGGRFGGLLTGAGALMGGGESALGGVLGAGGTAAAGGGLLKGAGRLLGRAAGPLAAIAMNVPDLIGGFASGDNTKTGGAVGGIGGSLAGGAAGAAIGTAILPGVGTLVGGAIGAFAGDFLGGKAGKVIGGTLFGGLQDSVNSLDESVAANNKAVEKKADEPPATGVNWSGSGIMDTLGNAWTNTKRFFTGEKVAPIAGSAGLGGLSAQYESGSKGSDAVGYDSTGGTSYGKYQISSKTMPAFMDYAKQSNPALYAKLQAAGPINGGTNGQMAQVWKGAVKDGTMGTTEHGFIKQKLFDPAFQGIEDSGLRDQISGSKALQDVLWSTSVQHGPGSNGASGIFNKVYRDGMSQEDLVKAVYSERSTRFNSSDASTRASVVQGRLPKEQAQALAGLAAEKNGTAATDLAENSQQQPPVYVPPRGSKPGAGSNRRRLSDAEMQPTVAPVASRSATPSPTQPAATTESVAADVSSTAHISDVVAAPAATLLPEIASAAPASSSFKIPSSFSALRDQAKSQAMAQVASIAPGLPTAIPAVSNLVDAGVSSIKAPSIPGMDTSKMEELLGQLVKSSENVSQKNEQDTASSDIPTIPFEFDDTQLALMAHDLV